MTAYPVDEGCFDWAVRQGVVTGAARDRGGDARFVARFSCAQQEQVHFEHGEPA